MFITKTKSCSLTKVCCIKNSVVIEAIYRHGGFAGDLLSFNLFGRASNGMYIHIDTDRNIDPTNIGLGRQLSSDEDMLAVSKQLIKTKNEVNVDNLDLQDK